MMTKATAMATRVASGTGSTAHSVRDLTQPTLHGSPDHRFLGRRRYRSRVNSRELIRWSTLHDRRSSSWWSSGIVVAVLSGTAIAGWVAWRVDVSIASASHAWLAAATVAFAIAFLRVPFHLYWRQDASLLAQLPIDGGALFDAALLRCLHAAKATTLAVLIGGLPIAIGSPDLYARHASVALALGTTAALFLPAVATWAATLVAIGQDQARMAQLRAATGAADLPPSSALLGALPGLAGTVVIVGVLLLARWLTGGEPVVPAPIVIAGLVGISVLSFVGVRSSAPRRMGAILRDVSALDRQRLAHLEIRPPTGIEKLIGGLLGDGALAYSKDARLVRRRYPMAFALGALIFLVLGIVGVAEPDDPAPWLTGALAGAAAYGVVLASRLQKQPIELPRLTPTLPIAPAAVARAKVAWVIGWWLIFVAAPGVFAVVRQVELVPYLALLGGATAVVIVAAVSFSRR